MYANCRHALNKNIYNVVLSNIITDCNRMCMQNVRHALNKNIVLSIISCTNFYVSLCNLHIVQIQSRDRKIISVSCPPQSCGGGTLIDTIHGHVDRLSHALAFYCAHSTMDTRCTAAHSTMDTHCTAHNLKEIPAEKNTEFCNELCRSRARQWVAIQYNRWRLCCRAHHGMFRVSWGLK